MSFWGMYGGFDDDRVDRSGWATKSVAAERREQQANRLFDAFLKTCESKPESFFPITQEVVGASTHLTGPCWTSFRRRVESKGCHAKRREATPAERMGDKRHGKMYVISVTVPVHPSRAVAVAAEQKKQAEAAAVVRKEKAIEAAAQKAELERVEAERKVAQAMAYRDKVHAEYTAVLSGQSDRKRAAVATNLLPVAKHARVSSPTSGEPVGTKALLEHAETLYRDRLRMIHRGIQLEKNQLEAKKTQLDRQAQEEYQRARKTILDAATDTQTCGLCHKECKLAAASCISEGCTSKVCAACLKNKVERSHKCQVCPEKAIVQNFKCHKCIETLKSQGQSYFQFEYCRNDCGFICPEHTKSLECCVCGMSTFCSTCNIGRCGKCGAKLCSRCEFKEGCMCDGKTGRQLMMEELGGFW